MPGDNPSGQEATGMVYAIPWRKGPAARVVMNTNKTGSPMEEVLSLIKEQDFSTIPSVLSEMLRISNDPNADVADLAQLCEKDIATSARMLRTANSIYFATRYQNRARTLKEAIVRIGFKAAQEIIMSSVVRVAMITRHSVMDYSTIGLWKHSIAVGIGNRLIHTRQHGEIRSLDPFLAGLLHDMGIAIEHQTMFARGFSDAIQNRYANASLLTEEESKAFGFTHEEIGEALARKWKFPDYLVSVIGNHHGAKTGDEAAARLCHINRISEWLCFSLNIGYCDFSKVHADLLAQSREALELGTDDIDWVAGRMHQEMEALTSIGWFSDYRLRVA